MPLTRRTLALSPFALTPLLLSPSSGLSSQTSVLEDAADLIDFGDLPASLLITMTAADGAPTFTTKGEHPDGSTATPEDHYRVGSITKIFTSALILTLLDEGQLDLDDPASTYITRVPIPADITIRQLLNHTSGLANYMDHPSIYDTNQSDPEHAWTPEELIALIADQPPTEPGTFAYANTNFVYLGILIEELTGQTYPEVLSDRILTPLQLKETWLDDGTASGPAPVPAWTYTDTGYAAMTAPYTSAATSAWTAGALVSTSADIHTFLSALPTGDIISAESFAEMTGVPPWEYGLGIIPIAENGTAYSHQGSMPGYSTFAAHSTETGQTLFLALTNDQIDYSPALDPLLTALMTEEN